MRNPPGRRAAIGWRLHAAIAPRRLDRCAAPRPPRPPSGANARPTPRFQARSWWAIAARAGKCALRQAWQCRAKAEIRVDNQETEYRYEERRVGKEWVHTYTL